jgi:hypothetical protein
MSTLEEFQAYREAFELQQWQKKPEGPQPPQMEFNLGAAKPTRLQKEIELPPIVTRMNERLVARKSANSLFNLRKVCEKAIASQERDAAQSGLELALRLIPNTTEILAGDPVALELLIANFLRFNTLATSDGFVTIEASVDPTDDKSGEMIIAISNHGCSRSLHPWTDWIDNPYQADCHETEVAAGWCAQLITRLGGRFEADDVLPRIACRLMIPVQLTRTPTKTESGPFNGELAAVVSNQTHRQIISEQLTAWGLNIDDATDVSEMSPNARLLIVDDFVRQSDELAAVAEENPELPIVLSDVNRSERFLKQLMRALEYEAPDKEESDLFG